MKNISIFLIALSMTFASCENFLDEVPTDRMPNKEAITSVQELNNAINGVYYTFINEQYGLASDMFIYGDLKGPDTQFISMGGHCAYLSYYQHTANDGHSEGFWQDIYQGLGRANYNFDVAAGLTVDPEEKASYDACMAELHAIRGWLHFQAAILYCQIPTVSGVDMSSANSGIPIADKVFPTNYKTKRTTLNETYTFITSELEASLVSLPKENTPGRINYWAAEALLSRVYLYMGNYNKALEYANDVIKNSGAKLYTIEEYTKVWSRVFTSESIFELGVTDLENAQRNSIGNYSDPNGYGEFAATDSFYKLNAARVNDIRSKMISQKVSADNKNKGYYTNKYPGQDASTTKSYTNSPKIIRLSEVYLIAAEAVLKGGTCAGANSAEYYVNTLRSNRITGYTNVASVTLADILDERQFELAFEGHRFFDLIRNNITFEHVYVKTVTPTDDNVIVAIPQREIDISPELKQNKGY